jgi:hypothetical protein
MGSPYKFITSALWALWHHGNSVPPHHCAGALHSFKAYAMKHRETLTKILATPIDFIHKSRKHNPKDLPSRTQKNNIANHEEISRNEKSRTRKN